MTHAPYAPAPNDLRTGTRASSRRTIEPRWQDVVGRAAARSRRRTRPARSPTPSGSARAGHGQDVRARHVPVPERRRPARRAPAGLHRHRRLLPLQADDRPQRAVHDGLRRVRSAGRAVRGADRPAPGDHHAAEHRQHAPPAAPAGAEPRPAAQRVHHRPELLPLDAVDLPADLQLLVRHRAATARPIDELVAEFESGGARRRPTAAPGPTSPTRERSET